MGRRVDQQAQVRERLRRVLSPAPAGMVGSLSRPVGSLSPGTLSPPGAGPSRPGADPSRPAAPSPAESAYAPEAESSYAPEESLAPASSSPAGLPVAAAFDPGRRGVRALAVVAALALLGAGVLAWRARPTAEPVAPAPVEASAGPGATGELLVVAVTGKVRRPGLVRLPPGARVADAIEAAGGVQPGTDLSQVNLARKVSDGELITIGVLAPPDAAGSAAGPAGKLNLNTATLAQLDALPGVGAVLAQRILDYRERHGGFRSVGDLRQVDGIGDARFAELKDLVTV